MKTKYIVIAALTASLIAGATAIKTWGAEVLRYTDLNSNFAHLHDTMVGGHGARLVNADVSASAAIAHSKLATPALVPKVWGTVGITGGAGTAACGASPCTVTATSGVTSVTRSSAGVYVVNFTARSNAAYGFIVSSNTTDLHCNGDSFTTSAATIGCRTTSTNTLTDSAFTILLLDNDT